MLGASAGNLIMVPELLSELALASTHLKVLMCIGKPLRERQLKRKRFTYFTIDLLSPWCSLLALLCCQYMCSSGGRDSTQQPLVEGHALMHKSQAMIWNAASMLDSVSYWPFQWLLGLIAGHSLLHLYYIFTWQSPHTRQVLKMSACPSLSARNQRFKGLQHYWYVVGTGYDIAVHAIVAAHLAMAVLVS